MILSGNRHNGRFLAAGGSRAGFITTLAELVEAWLQPHCSATALCYAPGVTL